MRKYGIGDRVRATAENERHGDTGTVLFVDRDGFADVRWDESQLVQPYPQDSPLIEPIPTGEEKSVEQKYEVGGTLTLAEAIKAAKSGEIIADAREGSRAVWKEQALRWEATGNPVHIHEYYLTGWRVVPKPVPMTQELQEAIERYLDYAGVPTPTEVGEYSTFYDAYQKAKEAAK